jgi:penicillin-binding protein 1A
LRSALPIVGEVFQQSLRNRWLDASAEFDIPRPKPKPKARPERDVFNDIVNDILGRIFKHLQ